MAKATDIEIEVRIKTVAEMIIKGYSKEKIVRYSAENWKINLRQTETYIQRAHETFVQEAYSKEIDLHLNIAINQLKDLYQKSYAIQDYAECRRILTDLSSMIGFGAAKRLDVTSKGESIQAPPLTFIERE
jgi:hypothetical protein